MLDVSSTEIWCSAGELDSPHARAQAKVDEDRKAAIDTALLEKILKNRLATAAEHFNLDYKKAFLYLQVSCAPPAILHGTPTTGMLPLRMAWSGTMR